MVLALSVASTASAQSPFEWSTTELELQWGSFERPSFAGGGSEENVAITLQHADSWKYGDNFCFMDYVESSKRDDDFNNGDWYGECYAFISLGKSFGKKVGFGPIKDFGVIMGVNFGDDSGVLKFQPGLRLSWEIPGFAFLNTDFMAYIDKSDGIRGGGAPSTTDSWMLDVNGAYPFKIAGYDFSLEGHIEYLAPRRDEFGGKLPWWVFSQIEFRWNASKHVSIGFEWQVALNKLGDPKTDDWKAIQALLVYRF